MLIAGDDDQSLYGFRDSPYRYCVIDTQRMMRTTKSFTLPYCFRCPEVVVTAVNDILNYVKAERLLPGRIDKEYKYAASKKKDAISSRFPNIVHVKRRENAICSYIENELKKLCSSRERRLHRPCYLS